MPSITKTPGDFQGAQFEFEELLQIVADTEVFLCVYISHDIIIYQLHMQVCDHYESHYKHNKKIKIRISGDGAAYSRTSKFCLQFLGIAQLLAVEVIIITNVLLYL